MDPVLLLAHQGGWDEVLFVLVPVSIFAGLLWIANKKAMAAEDAAADLDEDDPG